MGGGGGGLSEFETLTFLTLARPGSSWTGEQGPKANERQVESRSGQRYLCVRWPAQPRVR